MPSKGYVEISVEDCKGCNLCVINCPTECLALNTSDTKIITMEDPVEYKLEGINQSQRDEC